MLYCVFIAPLRATVRGQEDEGAEIPNGVEPDEEENCRYFKIRIDIINGEDWWC
jgi:hypothetical protein